MDQISITLRLSRPGLPSRVHVDTNTAEELRGLHLTSKREASSITYNIRLTTNTVKTISMQNQISIQHAGL